MTSIKKTILSVSAGVFVGLLLTFRILATGPQGLDPVQTGTLTYTTNNGNWITNSFPFSYTVPPYMQFFTVTTNANPLTNLSVSTTNFILGVANDTNTVVNWTAFVAFPRIQAGTNAIQPFTIITNTFSVPFAAPPIVVLGSGTTNTGAGTCCVTNITQTNFNILCSGGSPGTNQQIQWMAVGGAASPGTYNPNFPSITY